MPPGHKIIKKIYAQLSTKFQLLITSKMVKMSFLALKLSNVVIVIILLIHVNVKMLASYHLCVQDKFHAQLS